jgi:hypothetical protein
MRDGKVSGWTLFPFVLLRALRGEPLFQRLVDPAFQRRSGCSAVIRFRKVGRPRNLPVPC